MRLKHQTIIGGLLLTLLACGQKGPLQLAQPSPQTSPKHSTDPDLVNQSLEQPAVQESAARTENSMDETP